MQSISPSPQYSDSEKVKILYEHAGKNMARVQKHLKMKSADPLWAARKNPNYVFRDPLYAARVSERFDEINGIAHFEPSFEEHVARVRHAYLLAKGGSDKGPMKDYVQLTWPLINGSAGTFTPLNAAALHFLSGTICFAATMVGVPVGNMPRADALDRAARDFESAAKLVCNDHLKSRALISLAGARQLKATPPQGDPVPLAAVMSEQECRSLLEVQFRRLDLPMASVIDGANAVKLASTLKDADACKRAVRALVKMDERYRDRDYPGWSTITPVSADPDLTFYRDLLKTENFL